MALTRGDQALQAAFDIRAPGIGADVEAFIVGDQALVGEADLGLAALGGDVEDDLRTLPFGLVLDEIEVVVRFGRASCWERV